MRARIKTGAIRRDCSDDIGFPVGNIKKLTVALNMTTVIKLIYNNNVSFSHKDIEFVVCLQ